MQPDELAALTARVRTVADQIQPELRPHPGLAARNAYAHVWLGLKVIFGEDWRNRITPASATAFLEWISANPNADYDDYSGPREELTADARGELF